MPSQQSDSEPLNLQLFRPDDDEEDTFYKKLLHALVVGDITPSKAATDFDSWIINDANRRLTELMKRPDPRNLTPEEEEQGLTLRQITPSASGNIEMVFPSIANLLTAFPPYHKGQERIIQFLQALKGMPEHTVPDGIPTKEPGNKDHMIRLWPFGGNWMALAEIFRREAYEQSYPYSGIEIPGSETQLRWRNLQHAIARLTELGLIDCGFLCALGDILPSSHKYPDLEQRKVGGPNRIGGDAIAGAQWIIWPDQCRFVYEQCKKVDKVDGPRCMWSMERWNLWKSQFAFVANDERFDSNARLVAKLAGQQMNAFEDEDIENKFKATS